MEKSNRIFVISITLNFLLLTISIIGLFSSFGNKKRADKFEIAIKEQRAIAAGFEYTNRELRQNINELYSINGILEKTNRELGNIKQGFDDANNQFGEGLKGLRIISDRLEQANRYSGERVQKIETILQGVESGGNSSE